MNQDSRWSNAVNRSTSNRGSEGSSAADRFAVPRTRIDSYAVSRALNAITNDNIREAEKRLFCSLWEAYPLRDRWLACAMIEGKKENFGKALKYLDFELRNFPDNAVAKKLRSDLIKSNVVKDPAPRKEIFPKISIVTPSFNQRNLLEKCIESVLSQGYPNLEYIIMDGGSSDGSLELIKEHEQELAYWQSRPDEGPYAAIQEGFSRCSGNIMGWLNSDDMVHPNGLFHLAEVFSNHPEIEFVTGLRRGFNERGDIVPLRPPLLRWNRTRLLKKENLDPPYLFIMQEGTFWARSLWERAGATLDLSLTYAADFELWARFFRWAPLYISDLPFGGFRTHSKEQRSSKFFSNYVDEVVQVIDRELALELPPIDMYQTDPACLLTHFQVADDGKVPAPPLLPDVEIPSFDGPLLSIVSVAFGFKHLLPGCVASVLQQKYRNLDYTVIDVSPSRESEKYLSRFSNDIKIVRCTRNDLPQTLNAVMQGSKGEIMHLSGGHAAFDPLAFRMVATLFERNPDFEWLSGRPHAYDKSGRQFWVAYQRRFCRKYFLKGNYHDPVLRPECNFWRRSLWEKAGARVSEDLIEAIDFELWIRFSRHAKINSTAYTLGGFYFPWWDAWTGSTLPYFHECNRLCELEREHPPTPLDWLDPPPECVGLR